MGCCSHTLSHARLRRAIGASACAAAAAVAVSCGTQNSTNTIAGAPPLPALVPDPPSSVPAQPAPSVTGLDRRNWPVTAVEVPRGQVEVQPTYYKRFDGSPDDPRARGDYPTIATALNTGGGRPTAVQDGFVAPASGILWLVAVPGQIIVLPPWTIERQPTNDGVQWLPPAAGAPPAAAAPATP